MSENPKGVKYATSFKEQFTVRGMIIGAAGAAILTMSSMYVALKLGALPWPIIFVALVSMFSLKLFGNTNINRTCHWSFIPFDKLIHNSIQYFCIIIIVPISLIWSNIYNLIIVYKATPFTHKFNGFTA